MKTVEVGKSFGVVMVGGQWKSDATFRKDIGKGRRLLHRLIIQISRVMYEEEI